MKEQDQKRYIEILKRAADKIPSKVFWPDDLVQSAIDLDTCYNFNNYYKRVLCEILNEVRTGNAKDIMRRLNYGHDDPTDCDEGTTND